MLLSRLLQKLKEVADLLYLGDLCPVPDYKNLSRTEADRLATDLEKNRNGGSLPHHGKDGDYSVHVAAAFAGTLGYSMVHASRAEMQDELQELFHIVQIPGHYQVAVSLFGHGVIIVRSYVSFISQI